MTVDEDDYEEITSDDVYKRIKLAIALQFGESFSEADVSCRLANNIVSMFKGVKVAR